MGSTGSQARNPACAGVKALVLDADFAAETAALTRWQILQQAGVAMLAHANVAPQAVLALLQ